MPQSFWAIYPGNPAKSEGAEEKRITGATRKEVLTAAEANAPDKRPLGRIVTNDKVTTLWVGGRWTAGADSTDPPLPA